MPELPVYNIKDGVLFSVQAGVGGAVVRNYLGMIKSGEAIVNIDKQDTTGPRDSAKYDRVICVSASVNVTNFVNGAGTPCSPPTGVTDTAIHGSNLEMILPASGWVEGDAVPAGTLYYIQCDLIGGGTLRMTCHVSTNRTGFSNDPNEESVTYDSCGMPTYN